MKKLLVGLLMLGSFSTFASEDLLLTTIKNQKNSEMIQVLCTDNLCEYLDFIYSRLDNGATTTLNGVYPLKVLSKEDVRRSSPRIWSSNYEGATTVSKRIGESGGILGLPLIVAVGGATAVAETAYSIAMLPVRIFQRSNSSANRLHKAISSNKEIVSVSNRRFNKIRGYIQSSAY